MSFSYSPDSTLRMGAHSEAQLAELVGNYKLTPATLMSELCDWWLPAPFLQYLSAEIAWAIQRGSCGLLVSAPPRHGKSKLITVATPLWVLERYPEKHVVVATYGEDLSTDFSRETKDLINGNPDKLAVRLRQDVRRVANFLTTKGGGLKAVGLRGTITGRGADVLIIDDYIKEPKEALSYDYLEGIKTWYTTVARTRLEPGAVVIIVATRWVTGDLHGHIERLEARRPRPYYKIIKIPALAIHTEDPKTGRTIPDFLGRMEGEPLFPERYTAEALEDIRYELQNRWFEAMFQQNPLADDSAITNPANIQDISEEDFAALLTRTEEQTGRITWIRSWDLASTKDGGDFTVGPLLAWDKMDKRLYIVQMPRGQWSAGRVETQFKYYDEADDPAIPWIIEQEPGSQGEYAVEHFRKLAPKRRIMEMKSASSGKKLLKAEPFLAETERHGVYMLKGPWNRAFLDEFGGFPEGMNDDQIDAIANGYNQLAGKKPLRAVWGRSKDVAEAKAKLEKGGGTISGPSRATWGRNLPQTVNTREGTTMRVRRAMFSLGR